MYHRMKSRSFSSPPRSFRSRSNLYLFPPKSPTQISINGKFFSYSGEWAANHALFSRHAGELEHTSYCFESSISNSVEDGPFGEISPLAMVLENEPVMIAEDGVMSVMEIETKMRTLEGEWRHLESLRLQAEEAMMLAQQPLPLEHQKINTTLLDSWDPMSMALAEPSLDDDAFTLPVESLLDACASPLAGTVGSTIRAPVERLLDEDVFTLAASNVEPTLAGEVDQMLLGPVERSLSDSALTLVSEVEKLSLLERFLKDGALTQLEEVQQKPNVLQKAQEELEAQMHEMEDWRKTMDWPFLTVL